MLLTIGLYWYTSRAEIRNDAELARIRAAGEPVTLAELDFFYAYPPPETDATKLWLDAVAPLMLSAYSQAVGDLPIVGTGVDEIPPPGEPWADLAAAEQLLADYQTSLDQLHEAAALGGAARFPVQLDREFAMLSPHLEALREGARLLRLAAHVHAHRGDAQSAAESIQTLLKMAHSLAGEPVLTAQLVRFAITFMAADSLRQSLATDKLSDDDLLRLQAELDGADYTEGVRNALLGERALGIDVFEDPSKIGLEGASASLWGVVRGDDFGEYLRVMRGYIEASQGSVEESLRKSAAVEEAFAASQKVPGWRRFRFITTAIIVPPLKIVTGATAKVVADNRMARTAIAIERFHLRHGRRPERLDELTPDFLPEIPGDPFDGQPLRYVVGEEEYTIYSVGPNGVDDGGAGDETGEQDRVFVIKTARDADVVEE